MKLTKKLFMAIMTLALVVVTLSASTFAWFTLGSTGTVEPITVNVTSGTGMEISKDGKSWRNKIQLPPERAIDFTAVTSFDGKSFYDTFEGALILKNEGLENEEDDRAANVKYYEQTFYVRVTKGEENKHLNGVFLDTVTGVNGSASKDWIADVSLGTTSENVFTPTQYGTKTVVEGTTLQFDALDAAKISFAKVASNAETVTKVYAFESETAWGSVPTLVDVDHDNNTETAAVKGINSGLAYDYAEAKGFQTAYAQPYNASATSFPEYIGKTEVDAAHDETGTTTTARNAAQVLAYADFGAFSTIGVTLDQGATADDTNYVYAKVTVRIWLEGWDADCINAILGQQTTISFVLKAY